MLEIWPGIESERLQFVSVWEEVFWIVTLPW
jgi:hypothetical protein